MATAHNAHSARRVDPSNSARLERARDLRARAEARILEAAHDAKRLALEALHTLEAEAGAPPAAVAEILLTLGSIRELLRELDAAETTYRRALALLEKAPAADEVDRLHGGTLARLGQVYCIQGRYEDADALSARRLRMSSPT